MADEPDQDGELDRIRTLTDRDALWAAIRSSDVAQRLAATGNPYLTDEQVLWLASDGNDAVRYSVATVGYPVAEELLSRDDSPIIRWVCWELAVSDQVRDQLDHDHDLQRIRQAFGG